MCKQYIVEMFRWQPLACSRCLTILCALRMLLLPFLALTLGATATHALTPECQKTLDTWCNSLTENHSCLASITRGNYSLPLYARYSGSKDSPASQWRCYSGSSLTPDLSAYSSGAAYCTEPDPLQALIDDCGPHHSITVKPSNLFTVNETKYCGDIRTPQPVLVNGDILVFGQCRYVPAQGGEEKKYAQRGPLGDDFTACRMIMKRSTDGGKTFGPMEFVSPRGTGTGVAIYDSSAQTLVLQYNAFSTANPYAASNKLMQTTSTDGGKSWSQPQDITPMIATCNAGPGGSVCGAAGSRIQTADGRLVFSGHSNGDICVWVSDDHGKTYKTSGLFVGDEHSIAQLTDGSLLMNGRGYLFNWKNRTQYRSNDGGLTWGPGQATALTDVNCEAAMVSSAYDKATLFFTEPHGPGRTNLRIYCSRDGGDSWPSFVEVNTGTVAAYSGILELPPISLNQSSNGASPAARPTKLLVIWEQQPNQAFYIFNTSWCSA